MGSIGATFLVIGIGLLIGIVAVISAGMSAKSFTPLQDKTVLVLQLQEAGELMLARMVAVERRLVALATEHRSTPMVARTLGRHAQPITFGYWLASAADALARDHQRLMGSLAHCDLCPLGAGALSTTAFNAASNAATPALSSR